jgi:hypothetical protein
MRTSSATVVPFSTSALNPAGMVMIPTRRPEYSAVRASSGLMDLRAKE